MTLTVVTSITMYMKFPEHTHIKWKDSVLYKLKYRFSYCPIKIPKKRVVKLF